MSSEDVQARRERHRAEFAEGTSWFLDIVLLGDGNGTGNGNGEGGATKQLIGSTGFRSFAAGEAEWGAIVHRDFQRTGVCTEAYTACVSTAGCEPQPASFHESKPNSRIALTSPT